MATVIDLKMGDLEEPMKWMWCYTSEGCFLMATCPECTEIFSLKMHRINPSGHVAPNVICPICSGNFIFILHGWRREVRSGK